MEPEEIQKLVGKSATLVIVIDRDFTIVAASKACSTFFGKSIETIIGQNYFDLFPASLDENELLKMRNSLHRVFKNKTPETFSVVRLDLPDPESKETGVNKKFWRPVHSPIFDRNHTVTHIIQHFEDVTDYEELVSLFAVQKKNIATHSTADEYLRNVLEQAPAPICVLRGPKHVFEIANREFLRIVGYRDIIGTPAREAMPELKGQGFFDILDNVYKTGKSYTGSEIPAVFKPRAGMHIRAYVDFRYQILYDTKGNKDGIFVLGVDVTEQVLARKKAEQSEKTLQQLFDTMPQKILHTDSGGYVVFFNQQWIAETGYSLEELQDNGWVETIHPDDFPLVKENWVNAFESGSALEVECRIKHKDFGYRWNIIRSVPIDDENGEIKMWVGSSTDIHEQKKQKEILEKAVLERTIELQRSNEELLKQNLEKERQKKELLIANKELESFAYISSHDLQEPLRKIQIFASRIRESEHKYLSDEGIDYFERMEEAAERMRILIKDLLSFSRIKNAEGKFETIDLLMIVKDVKEELKEIIEEKNATFEISDLCNANIIGYQFRQLMKNLISNALKFSKPDVPPHIILNSSIKKGDRLKPVNLSPEKNYCHISIKDNGIGFDPIYSERIFEVFQRLHNKDIYGGTGIGLAIVKKIVDNHKGVITANSKPYEGTTFDIYIPAE